MLKKFTDDYADIRVVLLFDNGEVIGFATTEAASHYLETLKAEGSTIKLVNAYTAKP